MNFLDFTTKAGWPASADTWEFMQNMIFQLQQLSLVNGTNYIVSGCVVTGGNTGNGIVVINGEPLPFFGGPTQPNVVIVDTPTKKQYFGGANNNYYHDRKAVFGSGAGSVAFNTFQRSDPANGVLARLDRVEKMLKPLVGYVDPTDNITTVYGSWLFWGRPAAEIPPGWQAVPDADWKGRVPVVLDDASTEFGTIGQMGGEKTHQLTVGEMPSHKHTFDTGGDNAPDNNWNGYVGGNNLDGNGPSAGHDLHMDNAGGDQAHNNLQPYKVVMFIRWIG